MKKLIRNIENMPKAAYIFLKSSLMLSCAMLLVSLYMFTLYFEDPSFSRGSYLTAVTLLENPAGVLTVGLIGMSAIIDFSK